MFSYCCCVGWLEELKAYCALLSEGTWLGGCSGLSTCCGSLTYLHPLLPLPLCRTLHSCPSIASELDGYGENYSACLCSRAPQSSAIGLSSSLPQCHDRALMRRHPDFRPPPLPLPLDPLRNGLWVGVWYTTLTEMRSVFGRTESRSYTLDVLYGIFPMVLGGFLLSWAYTWWMMRPSKLFKQVADSTDDFSTVKLIKLYKFRSPAEVEVLSRVMRKFDADGMVDEQAARYAELTIKVGPLPAGAWPRANDAAIAMYAPAVYGTHD